MEILSIGSWWDSLSIISKIYWMVAIPFSLIFIIQIFMTFIGADSDSGHLDATGDADASINTDHGIGFQLLSLKNLIAFFTIFGWSGLACIDSGLSIGLTIFISLISGLIMMVLMATIFYFMGKLTESGNVNMSSIVGKTASVYLFIPAKRKALGKIQVQHQGYMTLDALTDEENDIPTGAVVEIIELIGENILLVKKI